MVIKGRGPPYKGQTRLLVSGQGILIELSTNQNFGKNRVRTVIWESSENQFSRPKKKVDQFFEVF